jgi:hypothetical protein
LPSTWRGCRSCWERRGIAAAINGLGILSDGDTRHGVVNLQLNHVDRLVEIKDKLDALRPAAAAG